MRRSRWQVAAVAASLCALALGASACSSKSVSSGAASAGSVKVQGISGNVIKVGGVYESSDFGGAEAGFLARINRANRTHELGKYTIQVTAMDDDGESQQTDLSDVQSLVERQGVFAVAPVVTATFDQSSATFLAQKQVPYFGAGFTNAFCGSNTWGVSPLGCAIGGTEVNGISIAQIAHAVGKPVSKLKWAFAGLDIPSGTQADDDFAYAAQKAGGDVVYNKAVIPLNVGNLAPIVNAVEATKPDVIWVVAASQSIAMKDAIKATGYTGAVIDNALYSPGLLGVSAVASALEGTYVETTMPVLEESTPFATQMVKDYASDGEPTSAITLGGEYAYMTADDMIAALKKVAPNFGELHATLTKGFSYTPPDGGSAINYPFMFDAPTDCGSTLKVENNKYVAVTDYACSTTYFKLPANYIANNG